MNPSQFLVAVLDDEPQMRKALRRLLTSHGFRVEDYQSGREFLDALPDHPVDCLILDLHMPEFTGFDVLDAVAMEDLPPPVVVITGHHEPGTRERALGLGASIFLTKPVDEKALLEAIKSVVPPIHSLPI